MLDVLKNEMRCSLSFAAEDDSLIEEHEKSVNGVEFLELVHLQRNFVSVV